MTAAPNHVLLVAPSWVGDATMCTPAFRAIAEAWPQARRTLLCRPGIERVLAGLPAFTDVLVERAAGALGPWRAGRRIRSLATDVAVLFPNSFRTALAVRAGGVARRVGYSRDARGLLLTDRVPPPPRGVPASTVDYYCDLVERGLGIPVPNRSPKLALTAEDAAAAERALEGVARPFALLVPGGNNPAKRWPPERFAAVADELAARHGLAIAASGSPGEREVIEAIRLAAKVPVTNLADRAIDLGALKGVVAAARLVITNDTGPRHFAAAFGVPTVALFGPTDHRWTRLPGVPERVLVAEPFLPEELVADDRAAFCAIDRIAVGDVLAAADSLMGERTRDGGGPPRETRPQPPVPHR